MTGDIKQSKGWTKYYENQKKLWYNHTIPVTVKAVIRLVELHRSDSKGWSVSIRRTANLLGIAKNTALKAISTALQLGFLETNNHTPRKRRKLRLSGSLRAPLEFGTYQYEELGSWEVQPGLAEDTDIGSTDEAVNIKGNIQANNESQKKEIEKSLSYKETDGYKKLRAKVDSLRK